MVGTERLQKKKTTDASTPLHRAAGLFAHVWDERLMLTAASAREWRSPVTQKTRLTGYQRFPTLPTTSEPLRRPSVKLTHPGPSSACDRPLAVWRCSTGVLIRLQIFVWVSLPLLLHSVVPRQTPRKSSDLHDENCTYVHPVLCMVRLSRCIG